LESIDVLIPLLGDISTSDDDSVLELVSLALSTPTISVFDTETETESISILESISVLVAEGEVVSDSSIVQIPLLEVSVSDIDTIFDIAIFEEFDFIIANEIETLTENVSIIVQAAVPATFTVSDSEAVTDSIQLIEVDSVTVNEIESVVEFISIVIPLGRIFVTDTETELDVVQLYVAENISVTDLDVVTELTTVRTIYFIHVSDSDTVFDSPSIAGESISLQTSDAEPVTESVLLLLPILFVSVFDSETITDSATLNIPESVGTFIIQNTYGQNLAVMNYYGQNFVVMTSQNFISASDYNVIHVVQLRPSNFTVEY
jgi:hypothetical protein